MSPETMLNGAQVVTLEDALAGETHAPPVYPEFSVLLVGVLKLNAGLAGSDEDHASVRLYPANGREDRYYLIQKCDIDTDRVERVGPEVLAARGWIAEKVVRIRVRASAEIISVSSRTVEAQRLGDEEEADALSPCQGTHCAPGWECRFNSQTSQRGCYKGGQMIACPNCS